MNAGNFGSFFWLLIFIQLSWVLLFISSLNVESMCEKVSFILMIFVCATIQFSLFKTSLSEYKKYDDVTFHNGDIQMTVGVFCVGNVVMYKEKDSIRKVDYPLQELNKNSFYGELKTPLICDGNVFMTSDGKAIGRNDVLKIVTNNVITGYLPYVASNEKNQNQH